jgi:hypothetical protein
LDASFHSLALGKWKHIQAGRIVQDATKIERQEHTTATKYGWHMRNENAKQNNQARFTLSAKQEE